MDLAGLRSAFHRARPVLEREGWSADEVEAINVEVRRMVAENDAAGLADVQAWLDGVARRAEPAPVLGVVPVLSDAAEKRLADGVWRRECATR